MAGSAVSAGGVRGAVYRVDRAGRGSVLLQDERLAGTPATGFGLNGIVWAGAGVLVAALSGVAAPDGTRGPAAV